MKLFTLTSPWAVAVAICLAILAPKGTARAQDNAPDNQADLPVTRAVLFSSGVGYFEHDGMIEGNKTVRLLFKTDQINDVLKSMVVMDEGGGTATAVSYPSNDPLERSLQSFSIDLSAQPTLPDLLRQLRGAKITVHTPEEIEGRILGVETRTRVIGEPQATIEEHYLNLVAEGGLASIPMSNVSRFELEDPKLQEELTKALLMVSDARDKGRKPVEIRFTGEGQRRVRIGYLVETPVWKTSYRLDLSAAEENQALLQGWAIVENTSGSDWQNIGLSLVSGRPISFIQDLYTPLYLDRPVVQPELYASLRPQQYAEGLAMNERVEKLQSMRKANLRMRGGRDYAQAEANTAPMTAGQAGGGASSIFGDESDGYAGLANSAAQSVAAASDLGELFQYAIGSPVDLARRTSSMLPILNQAVKTEKISIYNQQALAKHPLNGALVTNETDLKLMAGPVTVFEDGAYAGDAQLTHLAPGEERLISYAVDLAVTVDASVKSQTRITTARIVNGVLHVARVNHFDQTYRIKNSAGKDRTLYIEHPFVNGRNLIEPKEPLEKTPQHYRFRVEIEAGKTGEFVVKEQQPYTQTIAILSSNQSNLQWYSTSGEIPSKVREALKKAIQLKNELSELQRELQQQQGHLTEVQQGQERLRQNIRTVGGNSTLGQRYIKKLADEEDQIEELQRTIADLEEKVQSKQKQLSDYLNDLDVMP